MLVHAQDAVPVADAGVPEEDAPHASSNALGPDAVSPEVSAAVPATGPLNDTVEPVTTPPAEPTVVGAEPLLEVAADSPEPSADIDWTKLSFNVHAFVSQGFLISTANNYLGRSEDGSFEFTEVAINLTQPLAEGLRLGAQLFSRKLGPSGSYAPYFDWYYLDYRFADWLGIRAGRTKIPFGLYNESNDVDAGHVPALLPQSLYPSHHRDILLAVTGGELYGNIGLGDAGQLEYRAYGGTFTLDALAPPNPSVIRTEAQVHYLIGGRLMWLTPLDGLQAGASVQTLRYDTDSTFAPEITQILVMAGRAPADFDGTVELEFPLQLWVGSIEYAMGDLLVALEYGRWWADLQSSQPALIPSSAPTNERYYAMLSYRVLPWLAPGVYYSARYEDVEKRDVEGLYQHDFAATLRFDLHPNWLLKFEAHLIRGTGALERDLNEGKELKDLEQKWALFLIKTTAYF